MNDCENILAITLLGQPLHLLTVITNCWLCRCACHAFVRFIHTWLIYAAVLFFFLLMI